MLRRLNDQLAVHTNGDYDIFRPAKGGGKICADSNCLKKSDNEPIFSRYKNMQETRGKLKWKKAKKFTRQKSIVTAAYFEVFAGCMKCFIHTPKAIEIFGFHPESQKNIQ